MKDIIQKAKFSGCLFIANSSHSDVSGQIYSVLERDVASDFHINSWNVSEKTISGTFKLTDQVFEGNCLVYEDNVRTLPFEISFKNVFCSNPSDICLFIGERIFKNGDILKTVMTETQMEIS